MISRSISRNSLLLGLFAIVTTAVVAGTFLGTREQIAENKRLAEQAALLELVPADQHDNDMLDDTVIVNDSELLGLREPGKAFIARNEGTVAAVILPAVAREGYSGDIELIVGIRRDGTLSGVRVLSHRETPGLGDKIELKKSDWIRQFDGRSLGNPPAGAWAVKKDTGVFDAMTGATITSRAVIDTVKQSLQYYAQHRDELLGSHDRGRGARHLGDKPEAPQEENES